VIVGIKETVPIAPLTSLTGTESRYGPANRQLMTQRQIEFQALHAARSATMDDAVRAIHAAGGATGDRFALCNCFEARATKATLEKLALRDDVVAVSPANLTGELHAPVSSPLSTARAAMNSDTYFAWGFDGAGSGLFVGVIDTGISTTQSLSGPTHVDFMKDCVFGDTNCDFTGDPIWSSSDSCVPAPTGVTARQG